MSWPAAVIVMDPFHVVALAGTKLDLCRQRIQQQTLGRRGHTGDPLYGIRRIARTRLELLSSRQYTRLSTVFDADEHLVVEVAWMIYQKIIAAYADSNRRRGKNAMTRRSDSMRRGVPTGLEEIAQLGRTLWRVNPRSCGSCFAGIGCWSRRTRCCVGRSGTRSILVRSPRSKALAARGSLRVGLRCRIQRGLGGGRAQVRLPRRDRAGS